MPTSWTTETAQSPRRATRKQKALELVLDEPRQALPVARLGGLGAEGLRILFNEKMEELGRETLARTLNANTGMMPAFGLRPYVITTGGVTWIRELLQRPWRAGRRQPRRDRCSLTANRRSALVHQGFIDRYRGNVG